MSKEQYQEYLIEILSKNFPCDRCDTIKRQDCLSIPFEPEIEWDFNYPKVTMTIKNIEYFEAIRRNPIDLIQYINRERVAHCGDFQDYLDGLV